MDSLHWAVKLLSPPAQLLFIVPFVLFGASHSVVASAAEFLFLLWAVYLCYAVRTVPSAFHEPRYMAIAVHNELVLSAIFYVIR